MQYPRYLPRVPAPAGARVRWGPYLAAAVPSSLYRSAAPLAAVHSRASDSTPTCRKRFGWSSLKATRRSASRSRQLPQPRQQHTPHWCTHSLDVSTAERTHRPALARPTRSPPHVDHTNDLTTPLWGHPSTKNARSLTFSRPLRGLIIVNCFVYVVYKILRAYFSANSIIILNSFCYG